MENRKRMAFNLFFLIVVFGATMYGVFHGADMKQLAASLGKVNPLFLVPGVVMVIIFIWGESIIIYYMMRTLSIRVKKWDCFLFSSVGFFFSCITPSATGGQPAQIYYMKKEKIPVSVSTVVLMIVTITYKLVLVVAGMALLIFGQGFIHSYLQDIQFVFYLGIGLNVFCVTAMLVLVFHPSLAENIIMAGLKILQKIHLVRRKEYWIKKLNASMKEYRSAAAYLRTHGRVIVNVFVITLLQRAALFSVTYFVYLAFGIRGTSAAVIVMLQAVISVSVDMLPLPGGMGISEKLFMIIFLPVFGNELLLSGMILSRGLGYYTELILSAVLTVVANFTIGKKERGNKNVGIL